MVPVFVVAKVVLVAAVGLVLLVVVVLVVAVSVVCVVLLLPYISFYDEHAVHSDDKWILGFSTSRELAHLQFGCTKVSAG